MRPRRSPPSGSQRKLGGRPTPERSEKRGAREAGTAGKPEPGIDATLKKDASLWQSNTLPAGEYQLERGLLHLDFDGAREDQGCSGIAHIYGVYCVIKPNMMNVN